MALSFPSSPSVGDYYSPGTRVWRWNGSVWELVAPVQFAQVGQYVETITPTPVGHQRLLNGPAPLIALLLGMSSIFAWGQATVSKVMVDVKMSDNTFEERQLTPVNDYVIGFDGSGNLVVKADSGGGGGGSGTVTSAAMTVPTGLSVSGSPITTTGTFAVTYTAGYQGYTSTEATKLSGIETAADVTDATNVAAAGALMTSALGTGVQTALGVNVGSAGAPVLFNGAGGTPTSLTLTNATGLPIGGITMNTARLLGRTTASAGAAEEISIGSGLSMSAGVLSATGGGGGKIAQVVRASTSTTALGTSVIPSDGTTPQNTDGTEILTVTITPTNASSTLDFEFRGWGTANANMGLVLAIFKDSDADALDASIVNTNAADHMAPLILTTSVTAGSTSSQTYKVRIGVETGAFGTTWYLMRRAAASTNLLNGNTWLQVTEVLP